MSGWEWHALVNSVHLKRERLSLYRRKIQDETSTYWLYLQAPELPVECELQLHAEPPQLASFPPVHDLLRVLLSQALFPVSVCVSLLPALPNHDQLLRIEKWPVQHLRLLLTISTMFLCIS